MAAIIKKINRNGNGHCINLDKTIMEMMGLKTGDEVQVTMRGGTLIVKKAA